MIANLMKGDRSMDIDFELEEDKHSDSNAMLTTIDNPYSPFTEYDRWKAFDTVYGHNTYETLAVLGSFGLLQSKLSETEFEQHVNDTMNQLIETDPIGLWIKVWPDSKIKPVSLENM